MGYQKPGRLTLLSIRRTFVNRNSRNVISLLLSSTGINATSLRSQKKGGKIFGKFFSATNFNSSSSMTVSRLEGRFIKNYVVFFFTFHFSKLNTSRQVCCHSE